MNKSCSGNTGLCAFLVAAVCTAAMSVSAFGRDINLDEVYLKSESPYQTKLLLGKIDAYLAAGSRLIDRGVVFSGWKSAEEVVFLKEVRGTGENILSIYDLAAGKSREIARFRGDVMFARVAPGGRYMAMRRLVPGADIVPDNEIVLMSLHDGKEKVIPSSNALLDFTLSQDGNSIFIESSLGIEEITFVGGTGRTVLGKPVCPWIFRGESPVLAYPSPDRSRWVLMTGGGGIYRACLIEGGKSVKIGGVTSSSEFAWVGNTSFAYRRGYAGNYTLALQTLPGGEAKALGAESFNTSMFYSISAGILSWLRDGCIMLYYPATNVRLATGLEGDDVAVDAAGSRFISLLGNRLFVTEINALRRRSIDIRRIHRRQLSLYQEVRLRTVEHRNEFTARYLDRKISLYRDLINSRK